jgi:hypothetical protein
MAPVRTRSRIAEVLFLAATLGFLAPAAVSAQLGSTFELEDRQAAVGRVPLGKIIRLRLSDGGRAAGPVLRWNALAVTLGPYMGYAEQDTFVAIQSIDTLWLRGQATRRGAMYGGISGLALGVAIGATAGSLCPQPGSGTRPCTQGAVTSAVAGLVLGGVVGAVFGSGIPDWRRLHPRGHAALAADPTGRQVILEAQDASTAPDPRALALVRTRPGSLVSLRFSGRPDLVGYVVRAGFRRVVIAPVVGGGATPDGPLVLGAVDGIWERGSAARTGSVLGALVAFGAGAYVASKSTSCDPSGGCATTMVADGVLAGIAGWIVGGRVGALFPRWQRRF